MEETSPAMVVLAGPNGAGKSTAAPALLNRELGIHEFVNADVIARGLSAFDPERAAFAAGRIMLARLRELAQRRARFAFETTLSSRSFAPWTARLVQDGYEFHLIFLLATRCGHGRSAGRPARPRRRPSRPRGGGPPTLFQGPPQFLPTLSTAGHDVALPR